jgi:hypothetical protein
MLKRSVRRLQQGFPGGGGFGNMLQQMQNQGGPRPGGAGGGMPGGMGGMPDPAMMQQMQAQMSMMAGGGGTGNDMQARMRDMMQNMGGGGEGGKIGVMAFGHGENEKGKKVARGAKIMMDMKTGKIESDFTEEQLEPDDMLLPKETVGDYTTDGAIEVDITEGTLPRHESTATSAKSTPVVEHVEVERVTAEPVKSSSSTSSASHASATKGEKIEELEIEIEPPARR